MVYLTAKQYTLKQKKGSEAMSQPNEPLKNLTYKRSNKLIMAKYNSNLLEEKIFAIAQARIEVNYSDKDHPLEARLYPSELHKLISDPKHIYRDLEKVSKTITGHSMFIEDGKGNFKSFAIVTNANYENGVFTIRFNNELRDHLLGLENKFTTQSLAVKLSISKFYATRLYDVLSKDAYLIPKITPENPNPYHQVEYNLSELRFIMGFANNEDSNVVAARAQMKKIDYDKLYDKLDKKDKKYEEWREFQRRVIKPAQEILQEETDIRFDYEGVREGRKVKRILFTLYRNIPNKNKEIIEKKEILEKTIKNKNRQLEMPLDLYPKLYEDYVGYNDLTKEDIDILLRKSDYNEDIVRQAIEYTDEMSKTTFINNYMGYIIKAIEENWTSVPVYKGDSEKAKEIKKIQKDCETSNKNDLIKRVWNTIKMKEDFEDFVKFNFGDMNIDMIEVIYETDKLVQAYYDYKVGRDINL